MTEPRFEPDRFHADETPRTGGFSKQDRVLNIGEYRRVYRRGFHAQTDRFGCYVLPTRRRRSRLGLSVSRKYGPSWARNRMKRRIREAFRRLRGEFPQRVDVVMVPRRAARELPLGAVAADLDALVRRALAARRRRK